MKVTVCELNASPETLTGEWDGLVDHVKAQGSDLVLLPEMPFYPWFGASPEFDENVWQSSITSHDIWQERLIDLAPAVVLGTRPVNVGGQRLNEGFRRENEMGYTKVHHKYYLPNEPGFWEANWYGRGDGTFDPVRSAGAKTGFAICTELWMLDQARLYGKQGVDIIVTPRATPETSIEKWVVGGRATAITSGAFSLSSNHVSTEDDRVQLGGQGWIIAPDGDVLGLTSKEMPFVTREIDLSAAEAAKKTYPRYVF